LKYTLALRKVADQKYSINKIWIIPDQELLDDPKTPQDELLDEIHAIKRKLLDDWYERFNGNKTLALFTLNHIYDVYFEQGGDDSVSIEKFIWNDKARQCKDFMYELQTRLLSNLGWVSL